MEKIELPYSDHQLLEECKITTFRLKAGPFLVDRAVRLKHLPTGIVTSSSQERDPYLNQIVCLKKLRLEVMRINLSSRKY